MVMKLFKPLVLHSFLKPDILNLSRYPPPNPVRPVAGMLSI